MIGSWEEQLNPYLRTELLPFAPGSDFFFPAQVRNLVSTHLLAVFYGFERVVKPLKETLDIMRFNRRATPDSQA